MLLAIDTASEYMSIAVFDGLAILGEYTAHSHNRHTIQLTQHIQQLFDSLGVSIQDLSALVISQGPGTYSGLRVGFGVAKGLATARRIPLIPVPTLDIVAAATPYFDGDLIVVSQAGRKRIHAGYYEWSGAWNVRQLPINTTWEELLADINRPTLINGEVSSELAREALQNAPDLVSVLSGAWNPRRAGFLAEIGWMVYASGSYEQNPAKVNPIYLKAP